MKKLEIIRADLSNVSHQQAVLDITDMYARDPMGMNRPLSEETKAKLIDELRKFPCNMHLIGFMDDKPAGIANCVFSFSTFYAQKVLNVHDLAVNPAYRGEGLGQALLAAVEKEAVKEDCCKVTLEVREDNRARSLYERFGFSGGDPRMFFMEKKLVE
ncbi:GNAT family N-acetyltransferase [Rhodohalobacter sp. 8-1]|uniref:GNAT family N-acetyltransferase n=1 Tax=Rhodohalobacter sp. 8-1 TaxID=3131972 RepID=UPI0030EC402F